MVVKFSVGRSTRKKSNWGIWLNQRDDAHAPLSPVNFPVVARKNTSRGVGALWLLTRSRDLPALGVRWRAKRLLVLLLGRGPLRVAEVRVDERLELRRFATTSTRGNATSDGPQPPRLGDLNDKTNRQRATSRPTSRKLHHASARTTKPTAETAADEGKYERPTTERWAAVYRRTSPSSTASTRDVSCSVRTSFTICRRSPPGQAPPGERQKTHARARARTHARGGDSPRAKMLHGPRFDHRWWCPRVLGGRRPTPPLVTSRDGRTRDGLRTLYGCST